MEGITQERERERDMANIFDEQQLICLVRLRLVYKLKKKKKTLIQQHSVLVYRLQGSDTNLWLYICSRVGEQKERKTLH